LPEQLGPVVRGIEPQGLVEQLAGFFFVPASLISFNDRALKTFFLRRFAVQGIA